MRSPSPPAPEATASEPLSVSPLLPNVVVSQLCTTSPLTPISAVGDQITRAYAPEDRYGASDVRDPLSSCYLDSTNHYRRRCRRRRCSGSGGSRPAVVPGAASRPPRNILDRFMQQPPPQTRPRPTTSLRFQWPPTLGFRPSLCPPPARSTCPRQRGASTTTVRLPSPPRLPTKHLDAVAGPGGARGPHNGAAHTLDQRSASGSPFTHPPDRACSTHAAGERRRLARVQDAPCPAVMAKVPPFQPPPRLKAPQSTPLKKIKRLCQICKAQIAAAYTKFGLSRTS